MKRNLRGSHCPNRELSVSDYGKSESFYEVVLKVIWLSDVCQFELVKSHAGLIVPVAAQLRPVWMDESSLVKRMSISGTTRDPFGAFYIWKNRPFRLTSDASLCWMRCFSYTFDRRIDISCRPLDRYQRKRRTKRPLLIHPDGFWVTETRAYI